MKCPQCDAPIPDEEVLKAAGSIRNAQRKTRGSGSKPKCFCGECAACKRRKKRQEAKEKSL